MSAPFTADALVVTGPHFRQDGIGGLLVTPTGGAQGRLADLLGAGSGGSAAFDSLVVNKALTVGPGGVFLQSSQDGIVAGIYPDFVFLAAAINRITGSQSAYAGVFLPPSVPGLSVVVINHAALPVLVYGNYPDTVQDVRATTGVSLLPGGVALFACAAVGQWSVLGLGAGASTYVDPAGNFPSLVFPTVSTAGNVIAQAGGGQGMHARLTASINRVTTVATAGDSVVLLPSAAGVQITVINAGLNSLNVFPAVGDAINPLAANAALPVAAGKTSLFSCPVAGQWGALVSA